MDDESEWTICEMSGRLMKHRQMMDDGVDQDG